MNDILTQLRSLPFLAEVGDATLSKIAAKATKHTVAKGEPLCREGQPCGGAWIVAQGSIRSVKGSANGRLQILDTVHAPGTCSLGATLEGTLCPSQTEARVDSTLIFVPRGVLVEAAEGDPKLGLALARYLGTRLRTATTQLASIGMRDVRTRVAAFLVEEANARGTAGADGHVQLRLPGSQEEVARRLGTEREVFARALRSLKTEGFIAHARDRVTILDSERLRKLAEEF